ncbi:hypothetical protein Tco_0272124 [Tanacetum coccineum]
MLTTRPVCPPSLVSCLSSLGESLPSVPYVYGQSLEALPSQFAASGSESHVPDDIIREVFVKLLLDSFGKLSISMSPPIRRKYHDSVAFATGCKRIKNSKRCNRKIRIPIAMWPCRVEEKMTLKEVDGQTVEEIETKIIAKDGTITRVPGQFQGYETSKEEPFAPHRLPQPKGNMNGWLIEVEEEVERNEVDSDLESTASSKPVWKKTTKADHDRASLKQSAVVPLTKGNTKRKIVERVRESQLKKIELLETPPISAVKIHALKEEKKARNHLTYGHLQGTAEKFHMECTSKGTNDGKKRDSFYQDQGAGKKEQNQNCLLTMDDGVVNWGEHTVEEEETNHALMAISSNNETNNFKGVPHPLYGDYTPKPQEEIDDYVYGKKGPQKPEIKSISVPNEKSTSKSVTTDEKVVSESKEVEPSCATHVKTPRQHMKNQGTPEVKGKNWNKMMERELGEGYSFINKKCFVCGSLRHLIKDCDFYEKKMTREAELKKQRVFNTGNGVAKPVWNNWRGTRPNFNYNSESNFVRTVNVKGPQGRPKPEKAWVLPIMDAREECQGFAEIVDFLRGSNLRYALTSNPTIYDSLVKQFWQTATANTKADGSLEINATIDTIGYTITEASIRDSLQLEDATGITMLPNDELFEGMGQMGYPTDGTFTFWKSFFTPQWRYLVHHLLHCISSKSGGWDQFGSNIATALICLSTDRVYNFSKLIFDGMVANLKSKTKFLMYPRFLQMILNIQTENKHLYLAVSLTKKIFGNMKRGFRGAPRPLLPAMLLVATNPNAGQEHDAVAQSQPSSSILPVPSTSSPPV